jgi:hypothetical protein
MPTSLISIVAGMVLVGIMALMAVPSMNAGNVIRLDQTTNRLIWLIHLAQRLSHNTGTEHGVRWDSGAAVFEVVRADFSQSPPVIVETVLDPVSRQPARMTLDRGVSLSGNLPFTFNVMGASNVIYFDDWGTPVNRLTGSNLQLASTQLGFSHGNMTRTVSIQPVTGQVVVN